MTEQVNLIPARLKSAVVGGHVAGAADIIDDAKGKTQNQINAEVDEELTDRYTKDETYNKTELNNLITTPDQKYVTVTATDQTTAVTDVLPATGEADTVYRVGNWNGTQYDTGAYTEYAWNGSAYIPLSKKEPGIDDVPTAGSNNLVKSNAVAKHDNAYYFTRGGIVFDLVHNKVTLNDGVHYVRIGRNIFTLTLETDTEYILDINNRWLIWDLDRNVIELVNSLSGNICILLYFDAITRVIEGGLLAEYYLFHKQPSYISSSLRGRLEINDNVFTIKKAGFASSVSFTIGNKNYGLNLSEDLVFTFDNSGYVLFNISSSTIRQDVLANIGYDDFVLMRYDAVSGFVSGILYETYLKQQIDENAYGYWHGKTESNIKLINGRIDGTGKNLRWHFYVPIHTFVKFEFADTYLLFPDFLDEGLNRLGIEGATWVSSADFTAYDIPSEAVYVYIEIRASDGSRVGDLKDAIFKALQVTLWHDTVEERIKTNEEDINEIKENNAYNIQPFFVNEMAKTIQDCNDVMDGDCFVATIVTDNHAYSTDDSVRQTKDNLNNLNYFSRHIYNNAFIHLGDVVHLYESSVLGKTDKEVQKVIGSYLASYNKLAKNVLVTSGNHDGANANTFTKSMWQATQSRADGDNPYIHVNTSTMDFYWDCQKSKLRLVFIAMPNVSMAFKYSWNTLQWLKDVLESVEDTWNVIIFSHVPYLFKSYIGEEGMENKDIYVNICNAFNNHTSYTIGNFSVDFTELQSSKILCQVFGHNHSDKVWAAGESYNGFYNPGAVATTYINELNHPFVQLGCALFYNHATTDLGGIVPIREDKTVTQDLWTVMIYRPDLNKIYFKRFGAGNDFEIDV